MHMKRRNVFLAGAIIEVLFLVIAVFTKTQFVKDCIFALAGIGLFYLIEQKFPLNPIVIVIGLLPFYIHSAGVLFGFFGASMFGLGYDKWSHLINSLIFTIVTFYILIAHSRDRIVRGIILAFLVMLGVNLLEEVNEFVGSRYFGFLDESIFSMGDALPPGASDMQRYDTWWDMIFDIVGGLVAAAILGVIILLEKHHYRRPVWHNQ